MKRDNMNRTRLIGVRLTPGEYAKIEKKWKDSISRKLSEYVRDRLFEKEIVKRYRNQSLDDFMGEMSRLRQELNRIGVNYNQVVKKLHTLQNVAEFRRWAITHEVEKRTLFNKIDEIKKRIRDMAEEWLQTPGA